MNKTDLASHVAAETSATKATDERLVATVFSAIGDALAGDEPVTIAGFGKFVMRRRAARARAELRKPGSPSPSRPRGCRPSRQRRPFETRLTDSIAGEAALCLPFVPATPPRQVRALPAHTPRRPRPATRALPARLRYAGRRNRAYRIACAPGSLYIKGDRTAVGQHSPRPRTFVAGMIIDVWSGSPSMPCGRSSRSPDPRETGRHRDSPTRRDLRVSPATAVLGRSHHRPPGARNPLLCACLRPGLSSGAFGLLTAPLTASTNGSSASGQMPLGAAGGSKAEFDFSVDRFPGQGRQVSSSTRL